MKVIFLLILCALFRSLFSMDEISIDSDDIKELKKIAASHESPPESPLVLQKKVEREAAKPKPKNAVYVSKIIMQHTQKKNELSLDFICQFCNSIFKRECALNNYQKKCILFKHFS